LKPAALRVQIPFATAHTNGTLLDRKPRILRAVTGLVVSLDALAADPTNPLSKPAALPKVLENHRAREGVAGQPTAHHDSAR